MLARKDTGIETIPDLGAGRSELLGIDGPLWIGYDPETVREQKIIANPVCERGPGCVSHYRGAK